MTYMATGETIRLLRNWKKCKQKTIADKLGISQAAYSKLEKRKEIRQEKFDKILKAINCSKSELDKFENYFLNHEDRS